MRLSASDFYPYYRPAPCELRVYLRAHGAEEAAAGPYREVLKRLGARHEQAHLASFPDVVDLSAQAEVARAECTIAGIEAEAPVLYQPLLLVRTTLGGVECEVVGEPDFLIKVDDRYVIRDSKLSRRINENDHPEILRQLELYGWLFEQTVGQPPAGLEVHRGPGDIVGVVYDGGVNALAVLTEIVALKQADVEPYSPVGWSKCGDCGFQGRCWSRAEAKGDVAMVEGVDQGTAIALRQQGVETIEQLLAAFDEQRLAALEKPHGARRQKIGGRATSILRMANVMASGEEIVLATPAIPLSANYVMFDLEGLPPQLDELDKIYLWGIQCFGDDPGAFLPATAGFGSNGDREGWDAFLANANVIFEQQGDLPFVHWSPYEKGRLRAYVDRFGDPEAVAARVEANLLDLLPIAKNSIALPLPSYSLKVIERYIGFERVQEEYGGDWAMAKYIEATETENEEERAEVMAEILAYNREDLEATWAVLQWLKSKNPLQ